MWVVSLRPLRDFWTTRPDAEGPLRRWYDLMRPADLTCFADVRAVFASADLVGSCVVFNIGGNKYRLVARPAYPSHKVYVLRVMTHAEYDAEPWDDDCGCHEPEPE